jgi:DNA transformation protein
MPLPATIVAHVAELLAPLGAVRARRMFGGWGLYVDELFIALISGERLFLKVDEQTQEQFARAGCTPFTYSSRDRGAVTLGYWSAPDEAMDSPQSMLPWARLALASAVRAQSSKRAPVPRKVDAAKRNAPARRPASTVRQRKGDG